MLDGLCRFWYHERTEKEWKGAFTIAYCKFCGAEIPEGQQTCPKCAQTAPNGEEKKNSHTIHNVIWPKGGGSHPAARLLRILAQVTFWCGVVYLLSMLGNSWQLALSLLTVVTGLTSFLPITGILLGLAAIIELLDQRNQG